MWDVLSFEVLHMHAVIFQYPFIIKISFSSQTLLLIPEQSPLAGLHPLILIPIRSVLFWGHLETFTTTKASLFDNYLN